MSEVGIQPITILVAAALVGLVSVWVVFEGVLARDLLAMSVGSAVFVVCFMVIALFILGPS